MRWPRSFITLKLPIYLLHPIKLLQSFPAALDPTNLANPRSDPRQASTPTTVPTIHPLHITHARLATGFPDFAPLRTRNPLLRHQPLRPALSLPPTSSVGIPTQHKHRATNIHTQLARHTKTAQADRAPATLSIPPNPPRLSNRDTPRTFMRVAAQSRT